MIRVILLVVFSLVYFQGYAQSKDFTAIHVFTSDIEGPAFDKQGNLYVVNFSHNGTIGIIRPGKNPELYLTLPSGSTANGIKFNSKGTMLLADWTAHNILQVNPSGEVSVFCHAAFSQPNDLVVNYRDQIFATDPDWKNQRGRLWRIDPNGTAIVLREMGTANGIALSPDQKTLYVNESVQRNIHAFTLNDRGDIVASRRLVHFEEHGLDGMACDSNGNLWVTRHGKGTIVVLSSDGSLLNEFELTGQKPSNLVFSPDGKSLFITVQDRGAIEVLSFR